MVDTPEDSGPVAPSNWSLALRQQRLDLIRRVLEAQALFLRNWGREPTAEEVARDLDQA